MAPPAQDLLWQVHLTLGPIVSTLPALARNGQLVGGFTWHLLSSSKSSESSLLFHGPSGEAAEVLWHVIICQGHTEPIKVGRHRWAYCSLGHVQSPISCAPPGRPIGPQAQAGQAGGFQAAGENC